MLVMTFNLRFANPTDGANEWQFRKDLVVDLIRRHAPDLLATQEGTVPMLRFLEAQLAEYLPLTAHRQVDETCQYPTSFYRAGRFVVKESGEFWLSQTPEVHRSLSWGSAYPRLATFGLFQAAGQTGPFYFINTHLDNISARARLEGARIDWILVTPPFRVRRVAIVTDHQDKRYPSDHFPYEAEVDY